jgi:uncharacterized cupin superfamily protein
MAEDAPAKAPNVVNVKDVAEEKSEFGAHWGSFDKVLTQALQPRMGRLGVVLTRVTPGKTAAPFHTHALEDEVFFVLSGRGVFRYGETVQEIKPGDCISCPAGTEVAHQLANPFKEDLVYLSIGMNHAHEVCTYPDSRKIMVRALHKVGFLNQAEYFAGEPDIPKIFGMLT